MDLLKILKTSEDTKLETFSDRQDYRDLVAEVNKLIKSKGFNEILASDNTLRKNLVDLLSQLYFHYYLQALNSNTSSTKTKMKKVFGPSMLSFFTHLREIDEKNLLYR